jgi:DNA primase
LSSIDELKLRIKETPISEIIGRYIPLTRKGNSVLAVCPFHDDSNPSMHVNDSRNMFKCFVDNTGGDAINFVKFYKKVEFLDALRDICQVMGWSFDDYHQEGKKDPKTEMAKRILSRALLIYKKYAGADPVFNDFLKNRRLTDETAATFSLGYAPKTGVIIDYLHRNISDEKDRAFALKVAEEIGIIKTSTYDRQDGKSHYDTFRERIVFPIWDQFGACIGFTTRAIRDDQKPKYMNSIDSVVFNKSNLLYGLHLAKPAIRDKDYAILVEGNMDQISLFQNGFENTVAIQGIALGEQSLKRLLSITKNIVFCFDNDDAGFKCSERTNKMFMKEGITPKFIDLGEHKDPDDFLKAEGKISFSERIQKAKPFIDIGIERLIPQEIPELSDRKLEILERAFDIVSPLEKSLQATERIIKMAKTLGLHSDPSQIVENYEKFLEANKSSKAPFSPQREPPVVEEMMHVEEPEMDTPQQQIEVNPLLTRAEKTLLQELVQHPECLIMPETSELLDFIESTEVKRYVLELKKLVLEVCDSQYVSVVNNYLASKEYSMDLVKTVGSALYKYQPSTLNEKVAKKLLGDLKRKLIADQLKTKRDNILKKQREASSNEESLNLLQELSKIDKEINELKTAVR